VTKSRISKLELEIREPRGYGLSDFRFSIFEFRQLQGGPAALGRPAAYHKGMYIGLRNIHFKDQPSSFRRSVLSLLAVVAVGFMVPARQAAQTAPPSPASAPHAQSLTNGQTHQATSQTTHPHAGTASKTHKTHHVAAHRTGARPATGKSAGALLAATKSTAAKPAPTKSAAKSGGSKSGKKKSSSKNAHLSSRQARKIYMAHLHPGTDRVTAIQQKLADVGYLKEAPSGQWDNQTREAMRRYQEDNGFPATGLPEAKSLMKLGLGPHPLPPELDRPHTQASNVSPTR